MTAGEFARQIKKPYTAVWKAKFTKKGAEAMTDEADKTGKSKKRATK
jgi:hypothetical protein